MMSLLFNVFVVIGIRHYVRVFHYYLNLYKIISHALICVNRCLISSVLCLNEVLLNHSDILLVAQAFICSLVCRCKSMPIRY